MGSKQISRLMSPDVTYSIYRSVEQQAGPQVLTTSDYLTLSPADDFQAAGRSKRRLLRVCPTSARGSTD